MRYLDEIVKQTQLEKDELRAQGGVGKGGLAYLVEPSVFGMDRKHFSYKKEMRQLFAESAQNFGAMGGADDEREERQGNNIND